MTTQPEALMLAEVMDFNYGNEEFADLEREVATELRRQHARIVELEAQLAEVRQQEPVAYGIDQAVVMSITMPGPPLFPAAVNKSAMFNVPLYAAPGVKG